MGAPEVIPERFTVCAPLSSRIDKSAIGSRVGGSFTALTVTVKVRVVILLAAPPSLTLTVMVAVPAALGNGVKLNDPLGFGLENFDGVGAWRKMEGKLAIDSRGSLPDGRTFEGPEGLKTILKADRDAFTQCLASKLLTYALGRGLERTDRPTVQGIAKRVAANDYRFSALAMEIVISRPFQMRRGDMR